MGSGLRVERVLTTGDPFRDWLLELTGERIRNRNCKVLVSEVMPSSHSVRKYKFQGENYAVAVKFFAKPSGIIRRYNPEVAMENEYGILTSISGDIPIPRPLGRSRDFHCALVTEWVQGDTFGNLMKNQHNGSLPRHLTLLAHLHRRIHASTRKKFDKEYIFSGYSRIFKTLHLRSRDQERFQRLLSDWRDHPLLDRSCGHRIHGDANPNNYILHGKQFHPLDFEQSQDQAHPIHDVGIICTELTHFFASKRGNPLLAEEYIRHYLRQYCRDERDLAETMQVLPFFMSYGYMRIARLYRNTPYQDYIVQEALTLLDSVRRTHPPRSALHSPVWTPEFVSGTRAYPHPAFIK